MNDPIVVWPPGTFWACGLLGLRDCTMENLWQVESSSTACCLFWAVARGSARSAPANVPPSSFPQT